MLAANILGQLAKHPRVIALSRFIKSWYLYGIKGGTGEELERVLQKAGDRPGGLEKVKATRDIAPHMNPQENCSIEKFSSVL